MQVLWAIIESLINAHYLLLKEVQIVIEVKLAGIGSQVIRFVVLLVVRLWPPLAPADFIISFISAHV